MYVCSNYIQRTYNFSNEQVRNAAADFVLSRHANIQDVIKLSWLPITERIAIQLLYWRSNLFMKDALVTCS